jgi:hypothetical protein
MGLFKLRTNAWILTNKIIAQINSRKITSISEPGNGYSNEYQIISQVYVTYIFNRIKVFDCIKVKLVDDDIWLPFFQRLRIRRAMRIYLLEVALSEFVLEKT